MLRPAEETLATMSGIKRIDANARSDGAQIFMQFKDWSRDVAIAASEARERLDAVRDELPSDLKRWQVLKPVRFLYGAADFRLTVSSPRGFDIGLAGVGRLVLNGRGTYTFRGETVPYRGVVVLRLR